MILRSRIVLPISQPPIKDGALVIEGQRIAAAGKWKELRTQHRGETIDLGDFILLPGLINAHCHLDYTDMAGLLSPPKKNFSDWIKSIVALKAEWSYTDFAQSWLRGAKQLLRSGTTTVVDVEAVPELLPDLPQATPLRVYSCLEIISLRRPGTAAQIVEQAAAEVSRWPNAARGLSPHAPYTTSIEVLKRAAEVTKANGWLLTTHVAESAEEFQMFQCSGGALFNWLKKQRDMSDCVGRTPVEHMDCAGVLDENFLAVHVNNASDEDIALLARRGSHVVHCPRSHDYFKHAPFRYEAMRDAGVNVCLGTDSLASVRKRRAETPALNMFDEMRAFAKANERISATEIVRLATLNAARAIGRRGQLGELRPGSMADLIALPAQRGDDPYESVLAHTGEVSSMIAGRWIHNAPA
jgi:cytosine/adenosine deaminase-related metal-dependent hydrolase